MGKLDMIDWTLQHKLVRNWRDYGAGVALRKSAAFLLSPLYRRTTFRIYRIDLTEYRTPAPRLGGFELARLLPSDDAAIHQIEDHAEWMRGQLEEVLRCGGLCLCLMSGDRLAAFNLVSFETMWMPLVRVSRPLRTQDAWSSHIAVSRPFRRRGLASQLRYAMFEELRSRGIRRFYGGTLPSNVASLRLTRRVGFREIVDIRYTKLLTSESWSVRRVR